METADIRMILAEILIEYMLSNLLKPRNLNEPAHIVRIYVALNCPFC